MKFSALGYLLLLLLSGSNAAVALEIGDQLCIQGFIMDYFCIQNVNMIDNGLVTLEEPDRHTVHCLVDVGICLDSAFEVLVESPNQASSTSAYTRGYRLDDGSKTDMISLARRVGSCSTCVNGYDNSMLNRGFKAVMKVTVLDLNPDDSQSAPPLIRVDERKDSSSLGNDPCQSEYGMMEGVPTGTSVNATPVPSPTMNPNSTSPRGEEKEEELADSGNGIHLFSVATIVAFSSLYASMIL
ncbi:unnamed protein product [Cylindrotheca closterium]|uniref:Uncharacterized protein n=1 Tax=Cylindrotheca closterium TaxID=2856 RepID=A0AAD2G1I5_9STRA|nr:unnamed protein product [Cylindrotheca closterium]